MTQTANQSYIRALNQRTALAAILEKGPVSKAQLARMLHLSKPAMADNVAQLLEIGIIKESCGTEAAGAVGRRPTMLCFHENFRSVITIDFYYQKSIFVLFDLECKILNEIVIRQTPTQDFESWVEMSVNAVRTLLSSQNISPEDLAAIGISSPGIISRDQKCIVRSAMYGAYNPGALSDRLVREFACPVCIKNSTNSSALGEWAQGEGRGASNLLFISCGLGLGAGIIADGRLYEGSQMAAGEVAGFVFPEALNVNGTLEDRLCIAGFLKSLETENGPDTFDEAVARWNTGDPLVTARVEEIALQLGCLVCNLVMTLNCEKVVLGGEYLVFRKLLIPYIEDMVKRYSIMPVPVVASSLQDKASNIGMATICREMYFNQLCGFSQES